MGTSAEIKQRASALAEKTDVNSITPKEVGGIMYDLASHGENVLRNGGTLGIRKVYESVAAMEADSTNPKDFWGDPIKKGNLVVIYDGTTTGVDNNKIYAFMKPGWELATKLDAAYATKAETDAKLAKLGSYASVNAISNDLFIHEELQVIKEISGAIIRDGQVVVYSGYNGIFSVRVYDISQCKNLLLKASMDGGVMMYVVSSTLDKITSIVNGTINNGTNNYWEIIENNNGSYLFVTKHYAYDSRVFNADVINPSKLLIRDSQPKIEPDEILDNAFIRPQKDSSNGYLISESPAYDVKYYNVEGMKKVVIRGCASNNTTAFAFCGRKGTNSYLSQVITSKEILNGSSFVNEEVIVPQGSKALYVSVWKTITADHVNNSYNIEVYGDKKDKIIEQIPSVNTFDNYILSTTNPITLLPNKANYRVLLYYVYQMTKIKIFGEIFGNITNYVFTSDASLNSVVKTGSQFSSSNGNVFFNEDVDVPEGAKFLWLCQNLANATPLTAGLYEYSLDSALNRTINGKNKYIAGSNIILCPVYGQSLAIGGDATPAVTNYGNIRHREHILGNENFITQSENTETSKWGLMESFLDSYIDENGYSLNQLYSKIMSFATGTGSTSITGLCKGTDSYNVLISKIQSAYDWAKTLGKTIIVPAFCWVQGEQDRQNTDIDYKSMLEQLRIDIDSDVKAITGQAENVHCIVYQTNQITLDMGTDFDANSYNDVNKTRMIATQAQYELIRDNDYFHASTPIYPMEFVTSSNGQMIHINAKSQKLLGYYEGVALSKIIGVHGGNRGLLLRSASAIDDTHIGVDFYVPCPPLVIDTELVKEIEHWGFSVISPNNANIIKSVRIANNSAWKSTIIIETSENCHGSKLRYGINGEYKFSGWEKGARGNVRDSQGLYKKAIVGGIEIPLHNWCYAGELYVS